MITKENPNPKEKVDGLCKTFNLYVSFPKSRWPEIKIAEENSIEWLKMYELLKEEFMEKYLYKDDTENLKDVHFDFPKGLGKMS